MRRPASTVLVGAVVLAAGLVIGLGGLSVDAKPRPACEGRGPHGIPECHSTASGG